MFWVCIVGLVCCVFGLSGLGVVWGFVVCLMWVDLGGDLEFWIL